MKEGDYVYVRSKFKDTVLIEQVGKIVGSDLHYVTLFIPVLFSDYDFPLYFSSTELIRLATTIEIIEAKLNGL